MTGLQLKQIRKQKRWTQEETAKHLKLTQAYLSLLEKGKRFLTEDLTERVVRVFGLPAVNLPLNKDFPHLPPATDERLTRELAAVGYPGFSHISPTRLKNPAEVLLSALNLDKLDARVVEALPWLVAEVSERNWGKVVSAAKVKDLQNRLGFLTSLSRIVAERKGEKKKAGILMKREQMLADSRLLKEDFLYTGSLTETEKRWTRQNRTPEAQFWNVLSDLKAEHLHYAN